VGRRGVMFAASKMAIVDEQTCACFGSGVDEGVDADAKIDVVQGGGGWAGRRQVSASPVPARASAKQFHFRAGLMGPARLRSHFQVTAKTNIHTQFFIYCKRHYDTRPNYHIREVAPAIYIRGALYCTPTSFDSFPQCV
jgi:hypothetical protein